MDDPIQYYVLVGDQNQGPYTLGQLQAMWRAGSLTLDTKYWFEGQGEWMPLSTILELLEPAMPAPRGYMEQPACFETPPKPKANVGKVMRGMIFGCLGVFLILLIIGIFANHGGVPAGETKMANPNYQSLTFQNSYYDVIRVLGRPDKEVEETDALLPNLGLGYADRQWLVLILYDRNTNSGSWDFDKEKTHYLGIVTTKGTVIHVADEKKRSLLDAWVLTITNQER